jgi:uncharacterized protein YhjY with autotransporter beta-barrel domain
MKHSWGCTTIWGIKLLGILDFILKKAGGRTMNTNRFRDNWIKAPVADQPGASVAIPGKGCSIPKGLFAFLIGAVILIFPFAGNSQPLDGAVNQQLAAGAVTRNPCEVLLGSDPVTVLKGGLFNICTRIIPGTGPSPSSGAAGGGQGTASTRPGVVKERMDEGRGEKETEEGEADIALEFGKVGVFLSGEYYDSIIRRVTVGADVQMTRHALAGLAFDTHSQDGRFDGPTGNFDVDSYRFLAYGSFLPVANLNVQVSANYGIVSTERDRGAAFVEETSGGVFTAIGTPKADFDADQYGVFVSAGYDFPIGTVTLSPRAAYEWQRIAYETYSESGFSGLELKYQDFDITSSLSSLGLLGSIAISTTYGVLVPQASFDWKHEFDLDQQDLDVSFVDDTRSEKFEYENEKPDRDYFEINAGLVFTMPRGFQIFGNYRTITNHSIFDARAGTVGVRYDF